MAGVVRQLAGLNGLIYVGPFGGAVGSIGEILSCLLIFVYISYVNVNTAWNYSANIMVNCL